MQLTAIFLTVCSLSVTAKTISQSITFSGKDVKLQQVFEVIEKQTGFFVFFKEENLGNAGLVSIDAHQMPLVNFMDQVLKGQPFSYSIQNTTVSIKLKAKAANKQLSTSLTPSLSSPPITGIVRGPDGQPIANANVVIKGTKKGTTTNADGSFSIEANNGDVIIVSSIGFSERQFVVRENNIGSISLAVAESKLDEVQIIAYGSTTKRYSTGNVSTVKGEDIQQQPVSNPLLAIAGRVPGVFVQQSSGVAGGGVKILIQGQNSISKGNEPFYVVDGVPYVNQLLPSVAGNLLGYSGVTNSRAGNPLNYINPTDIESISVLKDADATAIYGSRAANGAIIITTKKAKSGDVRVELNVQQGWGRVTRFLSLLNTRQFLDVRREAMNNDGATVMPYNYDVNGFWDTTRNTNWQKELIGNTSKYSNVNASISGGTDLSNYLFSATFRRETTVMPGDFSNNKGIIHFAQNSFSRNKRFSFQLSANYMYDVNTLPGGDLTSLAITLPPNAPKLYNNDASINWMFDSLNSVSTFGNNPATTSLYNYKNTTNNLIGNLILGYKILKGLDGRVSLGYSSLNSNERYLFPLTIYPPEILPFVQRNATYGSNSIRSWIAEPQVSYKTKLLNNGKFDALIGATFQDNTSEGSQIEGKGYISDQVLNDIKSATSLTAISNISTVYRYNAIFGRLSYIFDNKYILNFNARRDGSTRFGSENKFHNFWSLSGGWVFSEEKLFHKLIPGISFGKLRLSYGTTGNDQIDDYQYLNLFTAYTVGVPYQGIVSLLPRGLSNSFLQWEETKKLQSGLDLGFLNDKFLLTINYSRNTSSNQLLLYSLPIVAGFSSIARNFPAKVSNSVWEFSLNTTNISNSRFRWNSNVNFTIQRNKLVEFPNIETSSYAKTLTVGKSINIIKLFNYAGVNETTGLYQFKDNKGDLTSNPDQLLDRNVVINRLPICFGGFQNTVSYKNITLDFLFQYVNQKSENYRFGSYPGTDLTNQPSSVLNVWSKEGDMAQLQRLITYSNSDGLTAADAAAASNATYSDASFLRLKNMSLSVDVVPYFKGTNTIKNARAFIQAQNILTFTHYKGLDPENASINNLPPLRIITAGIQLGF
jgi:TonB-dependent starch-binding outer membrane protein SusC